MMKRFLLLISFVCLVFSKSSVCYAQMTDNEVIEYVQSSMASGMDQNEIVQSLLSKGVGTEQALRLKTMLERSDFNVSALTNSQNINSTLVNSSYFQQNHNTELTIFDDLIGLNDSDEPEISIFGHNIFKSKFLSFEPNENGATPDNYKLGVGDELNIIIYGDNEAVYNAKINSDGDIYISQIGKIHLGGLTVKAAQTQISNLLKKKYADIGISSSVNVSVENVRTILVNIMGEVRVPGTYRLSSFSSVFNSIYRAGGITDNGSLRSIKVIRGGETYAEVDLYGYLFDGKSDSDVTLQDGDIIVVPTYINLVNVKGKVKRPMFYEMAQGETLDKLFEYAGGFTGDSYRDDFSVIRVTTTKKEVATVNASQMNEFVLRDGDEVTVFSALDRYSNKIEVRGAVQRPGVYELGDDIATLRQFVKKAGGLKEDAYTSRAQIIRENDDLTIENISVDLQSVINGDAQDILLHNNDILVVSSVSELVDRGNLTISGYVSNPGTFEFADNMTVEDLIIKAGGLLDGASMSRVDVARRVNNSGSDSPSQIIGESFSFAISENLKIQGGSNFILKPYDVVIVRKSPSYSEQKYVTISGEVAFPGQYALMDRNERLTDLIARSGGLTDYAFIQGARIMRYSNSQMQIINEEISRFANKNSRDTILLNEKDFNYITISTDLEGALKKPGSTSDIVLQEGDRIIIPELDNTIRIEGEVMYPAAVPYKEGTSINGYIKMAGGFTDNSRKNRIYIIYPDGQADRVGLGVKVKPGSTIIVPTKRERERWATADILAITSASTSLITLVSIIANVIQNSKRGNN